MAGAILTEEAKAHGVRILPIDSEHSAICSVFWEIHLNTMPCT